MPLTLPAAHTGSRPTSAMSSWAHVLTSRLVFCKLSQMLFGTRQKNEWTDKQTYGQVTAGQVTDGQTERLQEEGTKKMSYAKSSSRKSHNGAL